MGIAVPIVTTVGTIAGIASQQASANRQREALALQTAQSELDYELQKAQVDLAREAAGQRSILESQVAQQEAQLANQALRQQSLSQALELESMKGAVAQQAYGNLANLYAGATQALQMRSMGTANLQQSAQAYQNAAASQLAASASRSQAGTSIAQAAQQEAQPFMQGAQAMTELGQGMLQSRQADSAILAQNGVDYNAGALSRVVAQSGANTGIREAAQAGQQGANLQRALAQRGYLQADLQEQEALRALRGGRYLEQDAQMLDQSAGLQNRAAELQYNIGQGLLGYNQNLVAVQEELNRLRQAQNQYDLNTGLQRNLLSIEQRNLSNAANLDAMNAQAAAQYGNQVSAIAANRAGIQNPNYMAGLVNVASAWTPYAMQQGWFSGSPAQASPSLMGGGGWSPYVDVRPTPSTTFYA